MIKSKKNNALIGHTGFVGSNLASQIKFDENFNSSNIGEISGKEFDRIYCAGVPAAKWIANQQPEADWKNIQKLMAALENVKAKQFVLISTVDVFPNPMGHDENTIPDSKNAGAYGFHRRKLEEFICNQFDTTVIRLPALFGHGLKKNAIFDLMNQHEVYKINSGGVFQFYDLKNLNSDIERALTHQIPILNLATEPIAIQEIAKEFFKVDLTLNPAQGVGAKYDFHSKYASLWSQTKPYLYNKNQIMDGLRNFLNETLR